MGHAVVNKIKKKGLSISVATKYSSQRKQLALADRPTSCAARNTVLPIPAIKVEQLIALLLSTGFVRRLHLKAASIATTTTIILLAIVRCSYISHLDSLRQKLTKFCIMRPHSTPHQRRHEVVIPFLPIPSVCVHEKGSSFVQGDSSESVGYSRLELFPAL
jgi:hypothetical protein